MSEPKYKRVLLKISGEALAGDAHRGLDFDVIGGVCDVIRQCVERGVQVGVVVGGGNFWRGLKDGGGRMERTRADHMGMLATVINALAVADCLEQRGVEGAIYVSEVARAMRQPMPAVSRGLRMMEQDGSIVRETDPNDRRKTFVRITPQGEQARLQSEAALNAYFGRIMARMTPEQIDQMYALRGVLLDAIEAENDAMQEKISTQKQGGPVDDENI